MKITTFQSDKGDCLLLTSAKGANVLVDGGMAASYREFVAPALGKLREQGGKLDLVYLSHIDEDHIAGILELVNDLVAWRVYDYQTKNGNSNFKKPKVSRPPEIAGIWHNAFSTMLKDNAGPIEGLLAQSSALLANAGGPFTGLAIQQGELAASVRQAIQLSQRIAAKQLNIPLNAEFGGQLAIVRSPAGPEATIGGMKVSVVGPFATDVANLREEWNAWLQANKTTVRTLLAKARDDAEKLGEAVGTLAIVEAAGLGDRTQVTTPNLASLMLFVEEGSKTVLLTGDGHADDILAGLDHHRLLDGNARLHLNVLKVQHHGSEHNMTDEFANAITADHYVLCGNGKHENPDLRVVELICSNRLQQTSGKAFKFWFNCSAQAAPVGPAKQHMRKVENLVAKFIGNSNGRMSATFLSQPSFAFSV